jgi:hypothetical protein
MKTATTRREFREAVEHAASKFAGEVWDRITMAGGADRADEVMRRSGGALLREILGRALSARSEKLGVEGTCACGGKLEFRQHRPVTLHTILPGRDVKVSTLYGQCDLCREGRFPLLAEMRVDSEGFTAALCELSLLAGVIEPFESASETLLGQFAGVAVSKEKVQALTLSEGNRAQEVLKAQPTQEPPSDRPVYLGIDGGMVFVDKRWQETKLGCLFREEDRIQASKDRGQLVRRQVVAVRGTPEQLWELLEPRVGVTGEQLVVVLGDGAEWIWNLASLIPNRVEVLDWYHADEHISEVARILYGEGTDKAAKFRAVQLERLADDGVDDVIEALRFLAPHQRSAAKKKALAELEGYLTKNRLRMQYKTFKARGFHIGSGCVESAVSHVIQQRMKRVGMRWKAKGADAVIALRAIYRSHGLWDSFLAARLAAA